MIAIRKILHPTDFSDYANNALPYVIEFARKFGAQVVLTHVVPVPTYSGSYEIAVDMTTLNETLEQSAREKMSALVAKFEAEQLSVISEIRLGAAFVEVIDVARKQNVDLIILATHGWGALKHMLLGSTAERVVRKAPCPVLTVRSPEHEFVHP